MKKTLYHIYTVLQTSARLFLNTFSKEIISINTKCRKKNEIHITRLKVLLK